jgi:hypothetical protein
VISCIRARRLIACPSGSRFNSAMPALTRRRNPEVPDECWHVYHGDVRVGMMGSALRDTMQQWESAAQAQGLIEAIIADASH